MMKRLDRLLMRYLRWRGWIVFWLDEPARHCSINGALLPPSHCWLALYESERKAGR